MENCPRGSDAEDADLRGPGGGNGRVQDKRANIGEKLLCGHFVCFRLFWLVCITKNMLLLCDLSSIWWHLLSHGHTHTHTLSLTQTGFGDEQMDRVDQDILLYCKSSSVQSASRSVFLLHSASPSQSLATSVNITLKCGWKCRAGGFRNYILFDTHSWIIRPDVLQCYPRGMNLWVCVVERLIEML